ncbi:MAG: type III secretion system export apparatus subunit SctT [Mesorhizobium sp.]
MPDDVEELRGRFDGVSVDVGLSMAVSTVTRGPHDPFSYAMFTAKEYAIGMVLGFVVGWVAWAVQSAGSLIDNQRGASMASMIDPLHGEETSSLGILLSQAFMTYILATGTFLALFGMLFQSYAIWPATRALPLLDDRFPTLVLNLVDYAFRYAIVLSGPLVAAMFLSEFALAIVSRFSPQVQVFVLAMPIKSAIAIFMLIFYFGVILSASDHELLHAETVLNRLYEMIGAEGPAALPPGAPP